MVYTVHLVWDPDAGVWIATSEDIPGLVLESESYDSLLERTLQAAPELLSLNRPDANPVSLTFLSERQERIAL